MRMQARLAGTSTALKQIDKQEKKAEEKARRATSEVSTPRSARASRASRYDAIPLTKQHLFWDPFDEFWSL